MEFFKHVANNQSSEPVEQKYLKAEDDLKVHEMAKHDKKKKKHKICLYRLNIKQVLLINCVQWQEGKTSVDVLALKGVSASGHQEAECIKLEPSLSLALIKIVR